MMKPGFTLLLALLICSCSQNQLILDPFDEGESLMIEDETAIIEFEQLMADVATPANEYKTENSDKSFFNSADVLNSFQDTQPVLGICRSGDKEYYYHIERDIYGTYITDMDMGMTDYIVSPKLYNEISDFIRIHTPVPAEFVPEEEGDNSDSEEETESTEEEET